MKRIMLLIFALMLSSAYGLDYLLPDDWFGNTQLITGDTTQFNMSQYTNTTICIPFVAGETGTIQQFSFATSATASTPASWCLDETPKHPSEDTCLYNDNGFAFSSMPIVVNWNVQKSHTYYFCYEEITTAGKSIIMPFTDTSQETGDPPNWYPSIMHTNDPLARPFRVENDSSKIHLDLKLGGSWFGFSVIDYMAQDVNYCYGLGTDCYYVSGHRTFGTNSQCSITSYQMIYDKFYYQYDTAQIDKIYLMLAKTGTGTFEIIIYDSADGDIYTSPAISFSVVNSFTTTYKSGWGLFQHIPTIPVNLTKGHEYSLFIKKISGSTYNYICTPLTTSPASNTYNSGYQGRVYGWTGSLADSDMFFIFDMDTDIFNETLPVTHLCNDSIDNDGDHLIDYPDDPSCYAYTDDSESPYDTFECNDGLDNDGDGFIDYGADPSCSGWSDNTESPRDASPEGEDFCLVEEGCLLKDSIPYSDELSLHGWYGDTGSVAIQSAYGSNRIYLDTDNGLTGFDFAKDITNPNIYDNVRVEVDTFMDIGGTGILFTDANYTFYMSLFPESGSASIQLRFDISRVNSVSKDYVKVRIYNKNGSNWDYVSTQYPSHDAFSKIQLFLRVNQIEHKYDMDILEYGDPLATYTDLPYANILSGDIYTIEFTDQSIDDSKVDVFIDNIKIYSDDVSYATSCDTWQSPYYLKETFNGYPMVCGWTANLNIFFDGSMIIHQETPLYTQFKKMSSTIKDTNTRYVTLKFDLNVENVINGANSVIRLYDEDNNNFFTTYWNDGVQWYYDKDGTGTLIQSVSGTNTYMFVIDMEQDRADIYLNGNLVVNDALLADRFFNLRNLDLLKIQIAYSEIQLDNLIIYSSTSIGGLSIPDDDNTPAINTETMLCGIIYREQPVCTADDDCDSGLCLPNHRCARYSNNYCIEHGYPYGNKCFMAGLASCSLTSAKDIIFDNFFLFAIFLILLMIVIYLVIIFRR